MLTANTEASSYFAPNIAFTYLAMTEQTFASYVGGWCGRLTHRVSQWLKAHDIGHKRLMITRAKVEGNTLYPTAKAQPNKIWYHSVISIDGFIHCPWLDERITVAAYCLKMFPGQAVCIEEDYDCCLGN